jgi:large subunit ribosomal protein L24
MEKLRKGDEVVVLTGTDKGKRGTVLSRDGDYLVVEGINLTKKHVRPNPMQNQQGGIIDKAMPIHQSNVAIFNAKSGKADRVGIKLVEGKNVRVFKSSGDTVGAAK